MSYLILRRSVSLVNYGRHTLRTSGLGISDGLGSRVNLYRCMCTPSKQPPVSDKKVEETAAGIPRIPRQQGDWHYPSRFGKWCLVRSGFYPSMAEVPHKVSFSQQRKAYDLYRIKISWISVLIILLVCAAQAWHGKRKAARGDFMNVRADKRIEELILEGRRERAEKAERERLEAEQKEGIIKD